MAAYTTTSKFINLSPYILMEYMYGVSPSPEKYPVLYGSTVVGFEKINNGYFNELQILNRSQDVDVTGNVRDRSAVCIGSNQYVLTDVDRLVQYLDHDQKFTSTGNLAINFPSNIDVFYDTIKFHILSGYDFDATDGVIFQIKYPEKSGKMVTVCQTVYGKNNYDVSKLNPNPIYFNAGVYDNYVEIKIPAYASMCYLFELLNGQTTQEESLGYLISSDNKGFVRNSPFTINLLEITQSESVDGFTHYTTHDAGTISMTSFDEFGDLAANIVENTDHDYFEYYPTWEGEFVEDFIYREKALGNSYQVIHDIILKEQVGLRLIKTSEFQTIQTNNFNEPLIYRPVIMNSKATSFTIDYTMRLYNKLNNLSIMRRSTAVSLEVDKYGPGLKKINLTHDPYPQKVYNKVVEQTKITKAYEINVNPIDRIIIKYVPSFFDLSTISVSEEDLNIQNLGATAQTSAIDATVALGQGKLKIVVNPFDNYFKFRIFNKNSGKENTILDLGNNSNFYLVFDGDSNRQVKVASLTDSTFQNPSKGEVAFRLVESESKKVLAFTKRDFHIVAAAPNGIETSLYHGTWILASERSTSGAAGTSGTSAAPTTSGTAGTAGSSVLGTNTGITGLSGKHVMDKVSNIKDFFDTDKDNLVKNYAQKSSSGTSGISSTVSQNITVSIDEVALANAIRGDESLGKGYKEISDYYTIPGRPGSNVFKGLTKSVFLNSVHLVHPDTDNGLPTAEFMNYVHYLGMTYKAKGKGGTGRPINKGDSSQV